MTTRYHGPARIFGRGDIELFDFGRVAADAAVGTSQLQCEGVNWEVNILGDGNYLVSVGGQQRVIASNTVDTLTVASAWTSDIAAGTAYAIMPIAPTSSHPLPVDIEAPEISFPVDIQARYGLRTSRDIAAPAIDTDYYLPAAGEIDLSNFIHSTWYIYATTNKPDLIQLEASMDGGTTWYKLEGFVITGAAFVLGTWNQIDCPLMLAQTRLLVSTGDPAPGTISLAVIRKA